MKKQHVEHVLRAAAKMTGEKQFIVIGSQALHAKFPDAADEIVISFEVDLIAKQNTDRTEWLNALGQDSQFHVTYGYYADPVDESTAVLPRGWKGRLVNLPAGDVTGLCLDPHDLAIAKYVARREKDLQFTRELARRGYTRKERLLELLEMTAVETEIKTRMEKDSVADFDAARRGRRKR